MIGYIKGEVTSVSKDFCFIETAGIGYRVFISDKSREMLHLGKTARLLTYMAVREDAILLYGFLTQDEYDLFLILISVSKIGPKVAMGILSAMEPSQFVVSIHNKDLGALTKLPGIGKKTAERLLVELKDKVGAFSVDGLDDLEVTDMNGGEGDGMIGEAAKYLQALGYEMTEILPTLKKLAPDCRDVSQLVSSSLREFGKR